MFNKKIKNSARIVGEIVNLYPTDKVTYLTIKTIKKENERTRISFPRVICFEKTKPFADKLKVGDFVFVECTIQSSKRDETIQNQSMRATAVNRIFKVDQNNERYHSVNVFRFFCRPIRFNRINEHVATARITFFTNRVHYITVVYRNADIAKVDAFCNMPINNPCILSGSIITNKFVRSNGTVKYTEDLVVSSFGVVKSKNRETAKAE